MIYGKGNKTRSADIEFDSCIQNHQSHLAANKGENAGKGSNDTKNLNKDPSSGQKKENILKCHICDELGHVPTLGPKYSKLIQYFTCERFVKMKPGEMFKELCKKQLCFQCLLPGASINEENHKKGWCQRDFVCKHPSHQHFGTKKQVLVCDEHKDTRESNDLLEGYKKKCILKKADLPCYFKEIKLSFYAEDKSEKKNTHVSMMSTEEKAIYQLQTIKVDGKRYSVFFDRFHFKTWSYNASW